MRPLGAASFLLSGLLLFSGVSALGAAEKWNAEWIWGPDGKNAVNLHRCFRGTFELDSAPKKARVRITSSGSYVLWINGVCAGRGPERSFPGAQSYDERDIAALLKAGANCAAILSEHAGVKTSSSIVTRPGLLAQIDLETEKGAATCGTGRSWKTIRATAWSADSMRISPMRGFLEIFDSRVMPQGWESCGFDDSGWEKAVSIGKPPVRPWTALSKRESPFPVGQSCTWRSVLKKGTVRQHGVLVDFPASGGGPVAMTASFKSAKRESWAMELRSLNSASCYLDGRRVPDGESESERHYVWRLDASPGDHVLFVGISVPPPGGKVSFHLSGADPLAEADWRVSGKAVKPAVAGANDVARYNGAENDSFEESSSAASVSRSRGIVMNPAGEGRIPVVILDFGEEVSGRPFLEINANEGAVADVSYAEVLDEGMPNPYRGGVRHADRLICRGGAQRWETAGKRAFRFMRIAMRDLNSKAVISSAGVTEEKMPFQRAGFFDSSDRELNRIWKTCARTLELCTEDAFIDCPWRERALWVSDFRVEALSHYVVTGDKSLPRRCLFLLAGGVSSDGLLNGAAPTEIDARLEEGGLLWILALEDYFRMTADLDAYGQLRGTVAKVLGWYGERRNPAGLLEYAPRWIHVDWEDRARGPEMGRYSGGPSAALNALYAGALSAAARLSAAWGGKRESEALARQAAQTAAGLNSMLWNEEKGVFADELVPGRGLSAGVSQQSNVLCLLYARPGPERTGRILKYILDERREMAIAGTPYFMHYFFSAMVRAGLEQAALSMLKRQWGWMLDEGATCFWEAFHTYPGWSACHGWSAHPMYFIASEVLGVKPAAPGYSRILISDFGAGPETARGGVPVPGGLVEVRWKRGVGRVDLQASFPPGREATAVFKLKDSAAYSLSLAGKRVWISGEELPPGVLIGEGRMEVSLDRGGRAEILLEEQGGRKK